MLGLVLSAASLSPVEALADPSSSSSATGSGQPSDSASTPSDGPPVSSSTPQPSQDAAPTSPSTPAAPSPAAPSSTSLSQPKAATEATDAGRPTTRLLSHPQNVSTSKTVTFRYSADKPGVRFRCWIGGPGFHGNRRTCQADKPTAGSPTTTTGSFTLRNLRSSGQHYHFRVQAYIPAVTGAGTTITPEIPGTITGFTWHRFAIYSPGHFVPASGPSFNNPMGGRTANRVSLSRVIRTIDGMPGYKDAYPGHCPQDPALIPGTIRISLYSLTDQAVAKALVAARRRCISVQVLMNNHLNRHNDPAWRRLEQGLGTGRGMANRGRFDNFAHLCSFGCRGSSVLHLKMYLFDSALGRTKHVVMTGSTNMTSNAAGVQWNDLYASRSKALYDVFAAYYRLMRKDNGFHRSSGTVTSGIYQTTFFPEPKGKDADLGALKSVHCTGAGSAGIGGRSIVYINMHAWFGTRGTKLANQVRHMYNSGCYVRVLYSFMSYGVFKKLKKGTGSRMSVRRTLFSHNGHTAYLYSHFKNISVSGYVGSKRSTHVAWTGSNNFTNDGTHFDEVLLRIDSHTVYRKYVDHFKYISSHKSSPIYANYSEPSGGGRAP
jgi:phospholipase D-like protein